MAVQQTTVANRVVCRGVGLHQGCEVEIELASGGVDTGIVFVLETEHAADPVEIPADFSSIVSASRATTLGNPSGRQIATVEHLLAALRGVGIDNARVIVRGGEIPILDGSAAPFVDWIRSAGQVDQRGGRRAFEVLRPFEIRDGERSIGVEPHDGFGVVYGIDFPHPLIGRQVVDWKWIDAPFFEREIAPARTFGFEREIESLHASGLGLGGGVDNAIILTESAILGDMPLRWPDEFVRHKALDLLGDLALLGAPIRGMIRVERGGHALHHRLVAAIAGGPDWGRFSEAR